MSKMYIADKETLDKVYNALVNNPIYGFIEHNNIYNSSQRIEYTDENQDYTPITVDKTTGAVDYGSWGSFPWLLNNNPYMVKSDGTPAYALDPNDYARYYDGTLSESDVANTLYDGGAFSWASKIYKQEYMSGNDRVVKFSLTAREGFEPVGFYDSNNNELEGVWIPMFYGALVNGKLMSISGTNPYEENENYPSTAIDNTVIESVSTRARYFGGAILNTLIDLAIMFGKSVNFKSVYGTGVEYDNSGTVKLKPNAIVGGGQFYGTSNKNSFIKMFHSIVWSNMLALKDPYAITKNGKLYISRNYVYDDEADGYDYTGIDYSQYDRNFDTTSLSSLNLRTVSKYGAVANMYNDRPDIEIGAFPTVSVKKIGTYPAYRFGGIMDMEYGSPRLTSYTSIHRWHGATVMLLPPVGVSP